MKASIITIGDEILIGQVLDTNTQWMANKLHDLGVELVETVSISDTKKAIVDGLNHALSFADLVVFTGGLGPTKDDVTKHVLTEYFEDELVLNQKVLDRVKAMFSKRGIPFNELNEGQAMLPKNADILPNTLGTASGMWFEKNGKIIVSLPGVPYEMKGLMEYEVLPKLTKIGGFNAQQYQTSILYGLGESSASQMLEDFERDLPSYLKLAYLPNPGKLRLRITGSHVDKSLLTTEIKNQGKKMRSVFKDYQILEGDVSSIELVRQYLIENKQTLAVAESCTGGKISAEITANAGVSSFFKGGVVAYSKVLKESLLKVSSKTIEEYSVVSEQVAKEMVLGVKRLIESDFAIATTGNAGPSKDKTKEDLGVVFIAVATPKGIVVEKFNFGQPREKVIEQAKNKALELLSKEILKNI